MKGNIVTFILVTSGLLLPFLMWTHEATTGQMFISLVLGILTTTAGVCIYTSNRILKQHEEVKQ